MSNYRAVDFDNLLKSLSNFPNLLKMFTYPNSDKGSEIIIKKIKTFKKIISTLLLLNLLDKKIIFQLSIILIL